MLRLCWLQLLRWPKTGSTQVVLMTSGTDERPFRLPWPASTVIYLLDDSQAHAQGKAAAAEQQLRVPSGCLLRRVVAHSEVRCVPRLLLSARAAAWWPPCPPPHSVAAKQGEWETKLEAAGFRGDRLSVWAMQVPHVGYVNRRTPSQRRVGTARGCYAELCTIQQA